METERLERDGYPYTSAEIAWLDRWYLRLGPTTCGAVLCRSGEAVRRNWDRLGKLGAVHTKGCEALVRAAESDLPPIVDLHRNLTKVTPL